MTNLKLTLAFVLVLLIPQVFAAEHNVLLPEVAKLLNEPPTAPAAMVAAYKYYLGIPAPESDDPAQKGAVIYVHLARGEWEQIPTEYRDWHFAERPDGKSYYVVGTYIPTAKFGDSRIELQQALTANRLYVERFTRLVNMGGMSPAIHGHLHSRGPVMPVLLMSKYRLAEINFLLNDGHYSEALAQLAQLFKFHRESLNGQPLQIEAMISFASMASIRRFTEDAAKDLPQFRSLLVGHADPFTVTLDEKLITEKIRQTELQTYASVVLKPDRSCDKDFDLKALCLAPERVLNKIYGCFKAQEYDAHKFDAVNSFEQLPLYDQAVYQTCSILSANLKKLASRVAEMGSPLKL